MTNIRVQVLHKTTSLNLNLTSLVPVGTEKPTDSYPYSFHVRAPIGLMWGQLQRSQSLGVCQFLLVCTPGHRGESSGRGEERHLPVYVWARGGAYPCMFEARSDTCPHMFGVAPERREEKGKRSRGGRGGGGSFLVESE